jgi:flavin-dependent dehydrogenase
VYRRYPFAEGVVRGPASAYEVDRAEFDELLLDNARTHGVDVQQGVEVKSFDVERGSGVRLSVRRGAELLDAGARMLIDASGQRAFVAGRLGLRRMDPELKNVAVFSHYEGAKRGSGDREGDISIVLSPDGWWWVIPLRGDRTSLGVVLPARALRGQRPDEAYFERQIASFPYLSDRFQGARRTAPVRTTSDYSYTSREFAGDHWLLVGDAAAFIDPVFSTGVYLAMKSAFRAADAVDAALGAGSCDHERFRAYERWLRRALRAYSEFVKGFYSPEFAEVMMHPSDRLQLRQAVTSLLAGHGVESFAVTWRIWIFRAITRMNRRWNLTPRLAGRREAADALWAGD